MKPVYDYISGYYKDKMYYKQTAAYPLPIKTKVLGPRRFGPHRFIGQGSYPVYIQQQSERI